MAAVAAGYVFIGVLILLGAFALGNAVSATTTACRYCDADAAHTWLIGSEPVDLCATHSRLYAVADAALARPYDVEADGWPERNAS